MDAGRIDRIARVLGSMKTRRGTLAAALGGPFALVGGEAHGARKKNKKKKACPPCRNRKQGKCKGTLPDGAECPGGTCQRGSCIAPSPPPPPPSCPDPALPNFCPNTGACLVACTGNKVFLPGTCTCQCRASSCCLCSGESTSFCSEIYTSYEACRDACMAADPGPNTNWTFAGGGSSGAAHTCLGAGCAITCLP